MLLRIKIDKEICITHSRVLTHTTFIRSQWSNDHGVRLPITKDIQKPYNRVGVIGIGLLFILIRCACLGVYCSGPGPSPPSNSQFCATGKPNTKYVTVWRVRFLLFNNVFVLIFILFCLCVTLKCIFLFFCLSFLSYFFFLTLFFCSVRSQAGTGYSIVAEIPTGLFFCFSIIFSILYDNIKGTLNGAPATL